MKDTSRTKPKRTRKTTVNGPERPETKPEGAEDEQGLSSQQPLTEPPALNRVISPLRDLETAPNQAEKVLQEDGINYKEFIDQLPGTVVEIDSEGNLAYVNLHGLHMFGYTPKDLENGLNIFQAIVPGDCGRMKAAIEIILRGGRRGGGEFTMVRKEGSRFPAFIHASVAMRGNRVTGLRAVVIDISDRKKAEESILESERAGRATIDALTAALCVIDKEGTILSVNRAWRKFADENPPIPPEYAVGMNYLNVCDHATGYDSGEAAPFAAGIRSVMEGVVDDFSMEYPCHTSQKERWFIGRVTRFPENGPLRLVITHENITDRLYAEKARRESETFLITLLDAIPIPVFYKDREGRYRGFNRAYEAFFGEKRERLIDKTVFDINPPELAEIYRLRDDELFEGGGEQHYESQLRNAQGVLRDVIFNKAIFTDSQGNVSGLVGAILDITDRKRAEEEKEALESRLLQAQKMEAIGTLAGGIAHDFNNILAAIIGFTEMALDDTPPDSPTRRHLELVLKSGVRGRDLVRQILAFSRKTKYERSPLSVSSIVEETAKLLKASLPSTIQLIMRPEARSDVVLANATEIQQILMNLSTNAAHAMREKGGELSITLADTDVIPGSPLESNLVPGPYLQLTVRDTGVGMDAKVMKRIFEPFFTTKEVGQGTGMGLAMTYGIVKSLGGDISVTSSLRTGTIFVILLPKAKLESISDQSAEEISGGRERILFIDDEEVLAKLGKATLEKLGYKVTAMTDGVKALKIFSKDPSRFDLVFTDQTMPEIPGINLAVKLLRIRPDLPIILCTGHSDAVSPEIAKEAGIREYLMKPVIKREMARAVRRVLDKSRKGKA
ncbi:MAG TPA: PAS domain S-box protein [Syntrophorhabdaceae bacterium]|jgi:PAS domain S-box-containing protein